MFVSRKKHIVSDALMASGAIYILEIVADGGARLIMWDTLRNTPQIVNGQLSSLQTFVAFIRLALIMAVFINAYLRLRRIRQIVPVDDYTEMAKLQEEVNYNGVTVLSLYSISQLLQIWGFILICMSILQDAGEGMYQGFIRTLYESGILEDPDKFVSVYNSTHGFKYIGMLSAMIIGFYVTGIFIRDNRLKITALALMGVFVVSFELLQMQQMMIAGVTVGVVWTSVVYHLVQTVGLIGLALYLKNK
jgi:hypothetical protein